MRYSLTSYINFEDDANCLERLAMFEVGLKVKRSMIDN